jgi:hypothetical protein
MRLFIAMVATFASAAVASAAPITFSGDTANSESGLGNFTGSLDYSYSAGVGTITIDLTNTSGANGGYLTAFAFNLPSGYGSLTVSMNYIGPGGTSFGLLGGNPNVPNDINVQPFGDADIGASTGGGWQGSGPPQNGLGVGQSGTWTFTLSGDDDYLSALTATGIFNTLTQPQGGSETDNFLVRFRGFTNGGSDKVPAGPGDDGSGGGGGDPDPNATPEPATMLTLAALGGMGLIGYRLRRKKA